MRGAFVAATAVLDPIDAPRRVPTKDYRVSLPDSAYVVVEFVMVRGRVVSFCKTKGVPPRAPRLEAPGRDCSARELIRWLEKHGAEPLDAATRKRLKAAGHLGMPTE